MRELGFYSAMSRLGINYRAKIMLIAFAGTHVPLLAIVAFFALRSSSDMGVVLGTIGVALVATLLGTAVTIYVLNQLLKPVLLTSRALRAYRDTRQIAPLPTGFTDDAGTLMSDTVLTLARLEDSLVTLETMDAPTGLPNRAKMLTLLEQAGAPGLPFAVVVLRVCNLERVRATYDQERADRFMRMLGSRLGEELGQGTPLARVDGESFAFVLHGREIGTETAPWVDGLMAQISAPVSLGGSAVIPVYRAGVSLSPEDGVTPALLLDRAVSAAISAETRAVAFHSPAARLAAAQRFDMEQALRRALEGNEFRLHFQPVVDMKRGRTVGAEALIRWNHPDKGLLPPALFIPLAERTGLIDEMGLWVMREACAQAARWNAEGLRDLRMAINVSGRQFLDQRLPALLREAISAAGVRADAIEIELTETVAMADHDFTRQAFSRLRDIGVTIAIDDFGTGYASMSALRRLPFDKLKIDREFVSCVDSNADQQAICSAMIALARGMGLRVLAEGTEREAEVRYLAGRGCDLFQGYFFSPPVPAEAFLEAIADIEMIAAGGMAGAPGMPAERLLSA